MTKHKLAGTGAGAPRKGSGWVRAALGLVMLLAVGPAAVPSESEPEVSRTDITTEWARLQGCLDDLLVAMQNHKTAYAHASATADEYDKALHDLLGALTPVVGQLGIVVGTVLLTEGHPIERDREDPCHAERKPIRESAVR